MNITVTLSEDKNDPAWQLWKQKNVCKWNTQGGQIKDFGWNRQDNRGPVLFPAKEITWTNRICYPSLRHSCLELLHFLPSSPQSYKVYVVSQVVGIALFSFRFHYFQSVPFTIKLEGIRYNKWISKIVFPKPSSNKVLKHWLNYSIFI